MKDLCEFFVIVSQINHYIERRNYAHYQTVYDTSNLAFNYDLNSLQCIRMIRVELKINC